LELAMMILDLPQARLAFAHLRPWRRALDAIEPSDARPAGVAYSLGDAVTYRAVTDAADVDAAGRFAAHHRYHQVCAVRAGRVVVESAPRGDLRVDRAYDDLDDTAWLTGRGAVTEAGPGRLLVPAPGEAVRVAEVSGRCVILRITVEGGSPQHPAL
jgi:evolved beta-galactosidase subunit beta